MKGARSIDRAGVFSLLDHYWVDGIVARLVVVSILHKDDDRVTMLLTKANGNGVRYTAERYIVTSSSPAH